MIEVDRSGVNVVLVVLVLILAFLHFLFGPLFDSWFAAPNLLVCGVLVAARQLRPGAAAALGFALGLLEDAMAVSHFGLATLLLVLLGYLGSLTRDLFVGEEILFIGTYLFIGTWLFEVTSYLAIGGDSLFFVLLQAPVDAIATGVVGYMVVPIMAKAS
ncbi:MAG: rod shape-determining protein MreD [Gemmatimonadetes bacterium]|uniref:Rod shape-determining protein MreD n=1 Tax=Candidatus Kutchimonas denitrificans TaxID=3056748 RepID=A0AAE5CCN4_9BACT|nr:rod shape-determining protein MreD [Gemmatimonadota bacterium]NIR76203.1 rod shape-determining protein MreD [Candidatus Kutchimonas denitrificans]NIS00643.1 rod shape-determining protein MreD [Gemmatimonadota bacterium]NIT66788.1 rod shape-determining protein MreD [Gemmatimonadota bacterium]NIV23387.1 rod shape-determining protein MreD [Gemmatimonadota bacterium]